MTISQLCLGREMLDWSNHLLRIERKRRLRFRYKLPLCSRSALTIWGYAMNRPVRISLIAALLSGGMAQVLPARAQEDDSARLGSVHFETSFNEAAQRRFDRGMRYEHSFWYSVADELFDEVLKSDPTCAIAYWGKALALLNNPHNPIPVANLPLGLAAIEKAKSLNAKTQRERDLIDALAL